MPYFDVGGKRYSSERLYTLFDASFDHETGEYIVSMQLLLCLTVTYIL
jgi:hypothetical protein